MKIKKRVLIISVIAGILIMLGLIMSYQQSIKGVVVDAEIGKPVAGAVVLAEWTRRVGIGDYHTVSVRAVETVTDKEGKFHVLGPLHPFVDPPDVTVYKKAYVAWNNKRIFPKYRHRQHSENIYQSIKLEKFNKSYSYDRHVSFILTCIHSTIASNKKKKFESAFAWELDLAMKEVKQKK